MTTAIDQRKPVRIANSDTTAASPERRCCFDGPDWQNMSRTAHALGFTAIEVSELERVYALNANGSRK